MRRIIWTVLTGALFGVGFLRAATTPEVFPLEEIEVGQVGVWRTVVEGEEIREFRLRILGVVDNFSGPNQPVILAEALDPEHILSGPVAGMSGSPVYIGDRILGAYAYGYLWPKEQAIIGITPIERMLEILEVPAAGDSAKVAQRRSPAGTTARFARAGLDHAFSPNRLAPVPAPLMLGGFSEATIDPFRRELEGLGFVPSSSPVGGGEEIPLLLEPGAPVAGLLMNGDFRAAATGTITWTDGERLLAFGHPFLQAGAIDMPLAGADIITVVRNLQSSFKLANVGAPAGRLYQDRLTGIAGEIGEVPAMTQLNLFMETAHGDHLKYAAELWPHPSFLPLLSAMALLEGSNQSLQREEEQTLLLEGTVTLSGGATLPFHHRTTGPEASVEMAVSVLSRLREITGNAFAEVAVEALDLSLRVQSGYDATVLRQVQLGDARPTPGRDLPLLLRMHDYRGEATTARILVPLPADLRSGQTVELVVADADSANRLVTSSRGSADSLADVLAGWRDTRPEGYIYIFLTSLEDVPEIGGEALPGLPPSVRATLGSRETDFVRADGGRDIIWEHRVPVVGVFSGQDRVTLTLE